METLTQKPEAQNAIDSLRGDAVTAEDQAYLDSEQAKLEQERAELGLGETAAAIGQTALPAELVAGPGGVAVPREEVQQAIADGQEIFEDNNRRG